MLKNSLRTPYYQELLGLYPGAGSTVQKCERKSPSDQDMSLVVSIDSTAVYHDVILSSTFTDDLADGSSTEYGVGVWSNYCIKQKLLIWAYRFGMEDSVEVLVRARRYIASVSGVAVRRHAKPVFLLIYTCYFGRFHSFNL